MRHFINILLSLYIRINIGTMVRTGFMLNMLGILVVVIVTWLLGSAMFDIEPGVLPAWLSP